MKKSIDRMITALMPDAIPDEDFKIEFDESGKPFFARWNHAKLGPVHPLEELHRAYMDYCHLKKSAIPTFDDTDPMPWLTEQHQQARRMAVQEPTAEREIINGMVFERKN